MAPASPGAGLWERHDLVEFARYALRFPADARPDSSVMEALRFLDAEMRGFYAVDGGEPATVALGDQVVLCVSGCAGVRRC